MTPFRFSEEEQLDQIDQGNKKEMIGDLDLDDKNCGAGTNVNRLRQRFKCLSPNETDMKSNKKSEENFRIFFHVMEEDHSLPDLIWNKNTRQELREALENELKSIDEISNCSISLSNLKSWCPLEEIISFNGSP